MEFETVCHGLPNIHGCLEKLRIPERPSRIDSNVDSTCDPSSKGAVMSDTLGRTGKPTQVHC